MEQRTRHEELSQNEEGGIRWILQEAYALRGWKLLPYALQNLCYPHTVFFNEAQWQTILACDGNDVFDLDTLSAEQKQLLRKLERGGYIRPCRQGESLNENQRYRFYPSRFKERVLWAVTGRCNAKCRHCFMSAPHCQTEADSETMIRVLDAFARCGIKGISLTGGEPLVRKDFMDLVDKIHERGMIVEEIYTNGLLVNEGFLEGMKLRRMHSWIQFSFDGVGHHDWLRGVPGSEEQVLSAMRMCRERGIPTAASMVLFRENRNSIRDTVNLLAECGCMGLKISKASAQGEWRNEKEHDLTIREVFETFLEYLPHYFEDGMPISLELEGMFRYDRHTGRVSSGFVHSGDEARFERTLMCGHMRRNLYVGPDGRVLPCMSMSGLSGEEEFENMLEIPLEAILESESRYMTFCNLRVSDFMKLHPECRTCHYRTQCLGGCRAIAAAEAGGDILAKDTYACEFFFGGWKEKTDEFLGLKLPDSCR